MIDKYLTIKDRAVGLIPGMRWALNYTPTLTTRTGTGVSVAAGATGTATASCNAGEEAVAGGWTFSATRVWVVESRRTATATWTVRGTNDHSGAETLTASVVCLTVPF